jgi:hypothetical protein
MAAAFIVQQAPVFIKARAGAGSGLERAFQLARSVQTKKRKRLVDHELTGIAR